MASSFGSSSNPQNKGFSFGTTTVTPSPVTQLPSFGFGALSGSQGSSFFSKPADPTSTATVAPFGAAIPATAGNLFFTPGTQAASSGLFGVGATTAGSTSMFGAATTSAPTGLFGSTTTPASGGFFGASATTTAPSLFGTGGTAGTNTGLFGTATTTSATTPSFLGLGASIPAAGVSSLSTSTTGASGLSIAPFLTFGDSLPSRGLGGVDTQKTPSSTGDGGINGKSGDNKAMKETNVPTEIATIVDNFKKYVKDQKTVREEIARVTHKPVFRVQDDVKQLRQLLALVSNGLQRNAGNVEKLKQETAIELKNVDIAQRTKDTPPGLQYENTAPSDYFHRLIDDFEQRMSAYRQQIETVEQHFATLQRPASISHGELTLLLHKIHETFIALAAQLQVIHEAVKTHKEHLLSYRRVFQGDCTDIFELRRRGHDQTDMSRLRTGPTPFSGVSNAAAVAMATALNRGDQPIGAPPALGLASGFTMSQNQSQFGAGFGFGTSLSSNAFANQSTFGAPAQTTTFGAASPFNLQKPPISNKRGKTK